MPHPFQDLAGLKTAIETGFVPDYFFFWGHTVRATGPFGKECLSQWYPAPFIVEGRKFATAEHFMMYRKATLFGDEACAAGILNAKTPRDAKALGRKAKAFDASL